MVIEKFMMDNVTLMNWDAFKTRLDAEFMDSVEKENAYLKLARLKQGSMLVNEFLTRFDFLNAKVGLTDTIHNDLLITLLEPALAYAITDQIYTSTKLPRLLCQLEEEDN
jgi:hypothetical protein